MKRIKLTIINIIFLNFYAFSAYLTNVPITITQPDGTEIKCFATGDEYYNWAHDKDGYTIIQDQKTGYYCYAILEGDDLVASDYVVGSIIPKSVNIKPYVNISGEKILEKANEILLNNPQKQVTQSSGSQPRGATGTVNNIVVYIRFAGQATFQKNQSYYTTMFNSTISGANSMRNYFKEVSYNKLDVVSHFYPINNGTTILSYQASSPRGYYCPYHHSTNIYGYIFESDRIEREHNLLYSAINYIKNQVPTSLNLDYNNDGNVDNVCFIIQGDASAWGTILWPHRWSLYSKNISINGKRVYDYNIQIEDMTSNSVLCHEMNHTFGAPDLYHYNQDNMQPVGFWDLMGTSLWDAPQHMGAYMKYKYGGWIPSVPTITSSGTYTLQPLTSATNNCYKIPIRGSSQYIVVEYRKQTGTFESSLLGSGLIIYRINETYTGNRYGVGPGGVSDEIYIFRPNGTISSKGNILNAYFSETAGRTTFRNTSNPYCFTVPNGDYGNIYIKNIQENPNNTLSFDIGFCDNNTITYSNTNNLPPLTNASHIQTAGTVIVKNTDNIIFEAGNEVILNPGFEVQSGGKFEINMINCVY